MRQEAIAAVGEAAASKPHPAGHQARAAELGFALFDAAGVDEVTWQDYGHDLEENLRDLQARVQRGLSSGGS